MGADIPNAQPMRSACLTLAVESDAEAERVFTDDYPRAGHASARINSADTATWQFLVDGALFRYGHSSGSATMARIEQQPQSKWSSELIARPAFSSSRRMMADCTRREGRVSRQNSKRATICIWRGRKPLARLLTCPKSPLPYRKPARSKRVRLKALKASIRT